VVLPTLIYVSAVVPIPVPSADSFAIAVRSWPSYKRGASGHFRDIGRVLSKNFDWLPFTPPLVVFSSPSATPAVTSSPVLPVTQIFRYGDGIAHSPKM
jgi:hypothetical protein